jgi:hypothetical protein
MSFAYKNSDPTSQRTYRDSIIQTSNIVMFFFPANETKRTNIVLAGKMRIQHVTPR